MTSEFADRPPLYRNAISWVAILLTTLFCQTSWAQDPPTIAKAIEAVRAVQPSGKGHPAAVAALKVLNQANADQIPQILDGMDNASPLVANWFRSSVNTIAASADELPVAKIKTYFEDRTRSHLGRLLAFDLLKSTNSKWAEATLPKLLDDPSLPLRARAVDYWLERSEDADKMESLGILATALEKARDLEQVQSIAKKLAQKGVSIDLKKQLGFLDSWFFVGRFDNKDEKGFDVAYGPELNPGEADFEAKFETAEGDGKWSQRATTQATGILDLNELIGKFKGQTVYAGTLFKAAEDSPAEIRIGTANAHKVYVNGKLIMSNEIYHNGNSADKFSAKCDLKKGDNYILVKLCQNEQTQPWAQRWEFQLRVCDSSGKRIEPVNPQPTQN